MSLMNAFEAIATESTSQDIKVNTAESNDLLNLLQSGLIEIVRQLQSIRNDGGMADPSGRVRVAIESSATVPISITSNQDLRTLATVSSVTNMTQQGGYALQQQVFAQTNQSAQNLRTRISIT